MPEKVVFYQLTHKFLNKDQALPEGPRQIMYYSLAIGHHVGVMDCFQLMMELPLEDFLGWTEKLPDGPGRHKLEGLLRWGEIEINQSHAADLRAALVPAMPALDPASAPLASKLLEQLAHMEQEPALYLMVRRVPA